MVVFIFHLAINHIVNGLNLWLQVGFLYLRYAADPKTLWSWFEPYVKDEEVIDALTTDMWYLEFVVW